MCLAEDTEKQRNLWPHMQTTVCAARYRSGQTQGYFSFPRKSWIRISQKDMLPWQKISPELSQVYCWWINSYSTQPAQCCARQTAVSDVLLLHKLQQQRHAVTCVAVERWLAHWFTVLLQFPFSSDFSWCFQLLPKSCSTKRFQYPMKDRKFCLLSFLREKKQI